MIPAKMPSYFENRILAGEMQHSRNASYAEILVKIDGGEQTALARHRGLKASPLLLFIKKGSQLAETRITDIKNLKSSYK